MPDLNADFRTVWTYLAVVACHDAITTSSEWDTRLGIPAATATAIVADLATWPAQLRDAVPATVPDPWLERAKRTTAAAAINLSQGIFNEARALQREYADDPTGLAAYLDGHQYQEEIEQLLLPTPNQAPTTVTSWREAAPPIVLDPPE